MHCAIGICKSVLAPQQNKSSLRDQILQATNPKSSALQIVSEHMLNKQMDSFMALLSLAETDMSEGKELTYNLLP